MRTLQLQTARAFLPLLQPKRYKGIYGGRGAAKSHFFAELLVETCMLEPGLRTVCVREIQHSLEQSVKRLIEDKIKLFGLEREFTIYDTCIETPGDGIIIFQGMRTQTNASIKSLEGYHRAWVEEASSLSKNSWKLLTPTIREPNSEIWCSWNPDKDTDPVDEFFRKNPPPDAVSVCVTYKDNPWFPEILRADMEWDRQTDLDRYAHVWLGAYADLTESRVFKNVRVMEFEAPEDTIFRTGADWGFSVDPTTLVRCFEQTVDPKTGQLWPRKRLYIDHDLYKVGIEIDDTPKFFDGLVCGCDEKGLQPCANPKMHGYARSLNIVADSARPETISYLRRHGYYGIEAAKKGANSVKEGVIFLQGYDIIIHPRCVASLKEFMGYSYKIDPHTNKVTNVLEDKKNHIIDPVRYAVEQLRGALRVREAVWG